MTLSRRSGGLLATPIGVLLVFGVVVPAAILLLYSFYKSQAFRPQAAFQLDSYSAVVTDSTYRKFAFNTLAISLPTTFFSVLGGFVLAYYLAFFAGSRRNLLLALVVISMMGSYLVRMYAWRTLLGETGIINSLLESVGIIDHPLGFLLFNRAAVVLAEVNYLMPFSALVFFASLSGVPSDYSEAARDLGAGRLQALRRVVLPQVGEAILGTAAFTFFLSCGDYITPVLLGGNNSTTFGTLISDQLRTTGNYPLGAAIAFVLVAGFVLMYLTLRLALRAAGLLPGKVGADAKA